MTSSSVASILRDYNGGSNLIDVTKPQEERGIFSD